jgi:hypothetical protein
MGNLPALLPKVRSADFSVKCQRTVSFKATMLMLTLKKSFQFSQSLRAFPVIASNNYPRISGKMSFTIEDKSLIIINNN